MNHFIIQQLSPFWRLQAKYYELQKIKKENPSGIPNPTERKELCNYLRAVLPLVQRLEIMDLFEQIGTVGTAEMAIEDANYSGIENSFRLIVTRISHKLDFCHFIYIPTGKTKLFEQPELFDDLEKKVFPSKVFPSAKAEIKNAGNCLAADLNTAAVFHLMRIVNFGLRALARNLGVDQIGEKELEYCGDGSIISEIETAINLKLKSIGAETHDEKWESETAFYRGLLVDLRYFKDVIRDPISHARKDYSEKGALDVFDHVRDFMQRLASQVSE